MNLTKSIDPQDAVEQLSVNALSALTQSAFGSVAGPLVNSELLDIFGIGKTDKLAEYMNKINAELQKIEGELSQLQASVGQVLQGITEIKEQIGDVQVQAMLLSFGTNAGIVKEYFTTYNDAIGAISSTDEGTKASAISDLYDLLKLDNALKIATAMTAIQQAFLPSLTEQEGLIGYQKIALANAILTFGAGYDSFVPTSHPDGSVPMRNSAGQIGWYVGLDLMTKSQGAATTCLNGAVLDTFRAFVTTSIQGLVLLNAAWLNTIHESQIKDQVLDIQNVLAAMVNFAKVYPAVVDAQVAANLQAQGKRLTLSGFQWDHGNGVVLGDNPFGQDWIQWEQGEYSTPADPANSGKFLPFMAQAPWTYNWRWQQTVLDSPGRIWLSPDDMQMTQQVGPPPGPSRYDPNAPSDLLAFLSPLAAATTQPS